MNRGAAISITFFVTALFAVFFIYPAAAVVRQAFAAAALLLAAGCYDVQTFDAGPYVLDDFEDGDFLPSDPIFDAWTCFAFNPSSNKMYSCDHDAGAHNSDYALSLDFTVTDPANGTQQDGGAGLVSLAAKPMDFSHFEELDFEVSLHRRPLGLRPFRTLRLRWLRYPAEALRWAETTARGSGRNRSTLYR